MADVHEKKTLYWAKSNFLGSPPHTVTALCAATRFIISIPLNSLTGTPFQAMNTGYISEMTEKNDDGLPKHSYFESSAALEQMVCSKCLSIFETYTTTSKPFSLQDYIQPSTLHVSIVKDASSQDGVIAKTMGDDIRNSYPWETERIAQTMENTHNSYNYGVAPVKVEELDANATVEKFNVSELFVTSNARIASVYQQVYTTTGQKFFFKPRINLMVAEFDREVSVLRTIVNNGLHRTLRVSPFAGLVLLDNGLVAGVLYKWLEGSPLAEQGALQNYKFHRVWKEQVEAIVDELHRHSIVWGDVNVHNIFIDSNSAAWVVDFGGNCNVEFVDEAIKETYEGDKQGIRRIFEEWLPPKSQPIDHLQRKGCTRGL
jgi:tRNA A-37 threonylcarbamoyl transferase component Bud32